MNTIKTILVPFDFTEAAINALDYSMTFIGFENNVAIKALYVSPNPFTALDIKESEASFNRILKQLNKKTKNRPELVLVQGKLTDVILYQREFMAADIIFMGTMGDQSADDHVTNTSKLVLEAECPILTVPYNAEMVLPKEIALVLGSEEIERPSVLNLLLDIARSFNAKVHVLTIYKENILEEKAIVEGNEETLEYYLEHFYAEHNFEKNQDVEKGILDFIAEKEIDLLAIIPRNHAHKTSPSEGRLTKLLTLHATVPVLTLD
ncbi:universal stress protein [Croceivirga radicis]|uniref:Universal stress protein UspA n=1 Tax=Croceivirga radicis TaxID=1929488 RepID=A0A1V6LRF5_9FLAO|nr:universal stress protein [Croceivirga radicis]OQD42764.1 universal stress protein UspA [Croceivirga radicis]